LLVPQCARLLSSICGLAPFKRKILKPKGSIGFKGVEVRAMSVAVATDPGVDVPCMFWKSTCKL